MIRLKNIKSMKIWTISDFHFGKYQNDSERWLNIMHSYFYEWFIPLLKDNKKKDDKLFILGDLFDNRTSINMKAINVVVKLFEDLSKIIECHVLLGNHDAWLMNSNDINSVCVIRNIPNVFVYETPKIITLDNLEILMMPWIHGKNQEKAVLEQYTGADLLFCHSDLNGCRTQLYPTRPANRNILDIADFHGFGRVFSGHIHIVQNISNFTFVGSPYHLDRNDILNTKGIFVYDTKKKKDIFIENDFSPEFKKIQLIEPKDFKTLNQHLETKNFIDLEVSNNLLLNNPELRLDLDKATNKFKIERLDFIDDIVTDKPKRQINVSLKDKSIKDISLEWTNTVKVNQETDLFTEIEFKSLMKKTVDQCFQILESGKK